MVKGSKIGEMTKSVKGLTRLVNSIGTLASVGSGLMAGKKPKEDHSETDDSAPAKKQVAVVDSEQEAVLDSAASIQSWLNSVKPGVSPAMAETIQGQLYVLSFVQTPTMSGMAVDNLIFCLDKSLKKATGESEKSFIRETFCSMIQNLMFIGDARLAYAIEKNREEAGALLVQAGDILDSTISAIATSAVTSEMIIPKVANIFADKVAKEGYFKKLGTWIGQKKEIESKRKDYYTNVVNMFKTLDRYSSLIGPSILICGMLERYRPQVLSYYRREWEKDVKIKSGASIDLVSSLIVASGQLLDSIWNPKKLGQNVQKAGKTIGTIKFPSALALKDIQTAEKRLVADLAVAQKEEDDIRAAKEETQSQLEHLSAFQFAKKMELRDKLKQFEVDLAKAINNRQEQENKLLQVQELLRQEQPILEKLEIMDEDFRRITEKYAVEL